MDEQRITELVSRKLAGEATPQELAELSDLVKHSAEAASFSELLHHIWYANPLVEPIDTSFHDHQDRHAIAFHPAPSARPLPRRYTLRTPVIAFALVVVIAGLLFTVGYYDRNRAPKVADRKPLASVISGRGERKSTTLPDGTRVFLNAGSRLLYDPQMAVAVQRLVELEGEAYFDVAHDARHPFVIHTRNISVKVLGTAFNIKAYPGEDRTETTLVRGSIELSQNTDSARKYILTPSQKFTITSGGTDNASVHGSRTAAPTEPAITVDTVETVQLARKQYLPETSWTQNKLIFDNESLEELKPKLERWFDVDITINSDRAGREKFTGAFATETIEQALSAMKLVRPINYTIHDKTITIH